MAVLLVGALAAGGAAYTASNDFSGVTAGSVAGYGTMAISGATVNSVTYTYDASGNGVTTIDGAVVDVVGDMHSDTFKVGYNGGTGAGAMSLCGTVTPSAYNTGTPGDTTVTCSFGTPVATSALTEFDMAVTG
jgi:hypothetical protein